jgi:hypothetical protein
LLSDCQFEAVSRWALDLLLRQCEACKADVTADFYYYISAMPEAASLCDYLFEWQVLNHLCDIRTERTFSIRGLTDCNQIPWT